jgi:predicted nucleotidyltransferase
MPVRSLNSYVFKWPDSTIVVGAFESWAADQALQRTDILGIGYFGSYAKQRNGVGSDLDILIVVEKSERPFWERALDFDTLELPVPAEILVYTRDEWEAAAVETSGFLSTIRREAVWVYKRPDFPEST